MQTELETSPFIRTPCGFRLTFKNGWAVSVQWGRGNLCTNRFNELLENPDFIESNTAEVLIFDNHGRPYGDCDGWRTTDSVAKIITETAAR